MLLFLLLAPPLLAATAPQRGAKETVDAIYRALPQTEFDYREVAYASVLKRLLALEAAAAHGEVGLIDAVPFCDCQDTAEDYSFTSSSRAVSPTHAEVTVRLRNGAPSSYRLDMVRLPSGWAVADIHGPEHASLVAWLAQNLAAPRRRRG